MKPHGIGGIYRPKYPDAVTGALKQSAIWWVRYSHRGKKFRESSKSEVRAVANALLKKRIGEAGLNRPVTTAMRNTTLNDLAELVVSDYERNGRDSTARQVDAFNWLRRYFGGDCLADEISTSRLAKYIEWRKEQPDGRSCKRNGSVKYAKPPRIGCSTATINRELASLRRAFRLATRHEPPLVARAPFIGLMRERNRRTGFFTYEEFSRLREHLPGYLKPVFTTSFFTGWRTASELLTRERRHIVDGMLVLQAGEGKTEQPRRFPLDVIPELRQTIEAQLEATQALEVESGRLINLLFHHDGRPIADYLPAWRKACTAAGLAGRIPHDFRRSAAKNLTAAGVDPFTVMQLVGWADIGMLRRYNIVDEQALKHGVEKLKTLIDAQQAAPAKVVGIRG